MADTRGCEAHQRERVLLFDPRPSHARAVRRFGYQSARSIRTRRPLRTVGAERSSLVVDHRKPPIPTVAIIHARLASAVGRCSDPAWRALKPRGYSFERGVGTRWAVRARVWACRVFVGSSRTRRTFRTGRRDALRSCSARHALVVPRACFDVRTVAGSASDQCVLVADNHPL
eukprot:2586994-Rhodomonas_salina.6